MKFSFWATLLVILVVATSLFAETVPSNEWTFKVAPKKKKYATGLKKNPQAPPEDVNSKFLEEEVTLPKSYNLSEKAKLSPIFDQGSCGSCVYNSVVKNLQDSLILRGVTGPVLSRQFLMDCGNGWSCNGAYFTSVAGDLKRLHGTPTESSYPYVARNQRCKAPGELLGKIESHTIINNTAKSIMTALYRGYPVSVTVGADGYFMNYQNGIYNACTNSGTNHEVVIEGWDCEGSVDEKGNCKFDVNGKLPKGVGYWHMVNSWGTRWGEQGKMRIKITSKTGRLCNNLAEEAGVLETGIPPAPEPTPDPPVPPTPPTPSEGGLGKWVLIVLVGLGALTGLFFVFKALVLKSKHTTPPEA